MVKQVTRRFVLTLIGVVSWWCLASSPILAQGYDPLPSWNDGAAKKAILDFVDKVTKIGGPDYVAPADRIATFDNDGTLWVEQPIYTQFAFAIDEVKAQADKHPEWKTQEPFKSILEDNLAGLIASGEKGIEQVVAATHSGMTTTDFNKTVAAWLAKAKHPRFDKPYTELIYQPMIELLDYLRANGFKTFIVSGGGVEFMRTYADETYGVPSEQVIGSSGVTKYEIENGTPVLVKQPKVLFVDDGPGKAEGINTFIGKRPIAAFGNSNGDQQMLEWTGAGNGARLMMLVYHNDPAREYAYGPAGGLPDSKVGTFSQALMDEAKDRGWVVIGMKDDWKTIFPPERPNP